MECRSVDLGVPELGSQVLTSFTAGGTLNPVVTYAAGDVWECGRLLPGFRVFGG